MHSWTDTFEDLNRSADNQPDKARLPWQSMDRPAPVPHQMNRNDQQYNWSMEPASVGLSAANGAWRSGSLGEQNMETSAMRNEQLFSAIVRMDVPPAPSSSIPAGIQNRQPSVSIEEARTALELAKATAGAKGTIKADQANGDSNSDEDDASPGSVGKSKRVLANRQSAHRSRLRKLQYIQDLETNVNRLQSEIGHLQPQLAFLRDKYSGLSDQNRKLRDRVAALLNEAHFKECLNSSLRQEITQLNALQTAQAGGQST